MNQLGNCVKTIEQLWPITDRFNEFDVNKIRIQFSLQNYLP